MFAGAENSMRFFTAPAVAKTQILDTILLADRIKKCHEILWFSCSTVCSTQHAICLQPAQMLSIWWALQLKIRVSLVRFQSRPPYTRRSMWKRATLFYCTNVARFLTRFLSNPLVSSTKSTPPYFHISFFFALCMFDIQGFFATFGVDQANLRVQRRN